MLKEKNRFEKYADAYIQKLNNLSDDKTKEGYFNYFIAIDRVHTKRIESRKLIESFFTEKETIFYRRIIFNRTRMKKSERCLSFWKAYHIAKISKSQKSITSWYDIMPRKLDELMRSARVSRFNENNFIDEYDDLTSNELTMELDELEREIRKMR